MYMYIMINYIFPRHRNNILVFRLLLFYAVVFHLIELHSIIPSQIAFGSTESMQTATYIAINCITYGKPRESRNPKLYILLYVERGAVSRSNPHPMKNLPRTRYLKTCLQTIEWVKQIFHHSSTSENREEAGKIKCQCYVQILNVQSQSQSNIIISFHC